MTNIGKRLDNYLSRWGAFSWESSNCCHFGAGWMVECGLGNPMSVITEVISEVAAHRIIRKFGGFESTVSHFLDLKSVGMPQLKIGDLVMKPLDGPRASLGIVIGRNAAFCGDTKVEFLEMNTSHVGWRIQK